MQELNFISFPGKVWRFVSYLWKNFTDDNCQSTAAALTYQTLFAVVPVLTVMYAAVAIMDNFKAFGDISTQLESFLFDNLVPENVSVVKDYLQDFSGQARNLGVPSLVLLGVTSFLMLFTIERTFNGIWKVKQSRGSSQRFLMYWAVLTLGPAFVIVGLGLSTYMRTIPLVSGAAYDFGFLQLVPFFLGAGMFTLVYSVVPNCSVPIKHAFIGGGTIAAIFELAKIVFSAFMSQSGFQVIYGAFAAVPLFLLWVYVSWTIVLLGAEFVKSLGMYRFGGEQELEAPLFQIIFLLELFYLAHQRGDVVREQEIRTYGNRIHLEDWTEYKEYLMRLKLVKEVDKGGMILARDLNEVSIWDLYENLPWQLPQEVKGDKGWERKLSGQFSDLYQGNKAALKTDLESLFRNVS